MTLDNLQLALKLNNIILLEKIKDLQDSIASITGTDLTQLKQDIKNLNDLLEQTKEDIESLNTTTISEITQRLDDIDTTIKYIKSNITDLDKNIQDNLDSIKELTQSFTDLSNTLDTHIKDTIIHVTQDDKDLWNATLQNAKDYAKKLFDSVTSFSIQIVDTLPTENIKEMTIYFIKNSHNNESDYYDEYMYINNKWEIIGSTFVNLTPYLLKSDFETYQQEIADKFLKYKTSDEINTILQDYLLSVDFNNIIQKYFTSNEITNILKDYAKSENLHEHKNKDILDLLSDIDGILSYNKIKLLTTIPISSEPGNVIQMFQDGIYVSLDEKVSDLQVNSAISDTLKILESNSEQEIDTDLQLAISDTINLLNE